MHDGRSALVRISRCAGWAAMLWPRVMRWMDETGVSAEDRDEVLSLLAQAVALGVPVDPKKNELTGRIFRGTVENE